jgi:GMP synthase (glutamine-hydrolysing)
MKPFLIVQCEVLAESSPRLYQEAGEIDRLLLDGMNLRDRPTRAVRVCLGEALPDPGDVAAVVLSGSSAMVADDQDWIRTTAAWVRQCHGAGRPMLGICFGHQLIAHALGGQVRQTTNSIEFGTITIEREPAEGSDPLLGELPEKFIAQAAHFQTVTEPPEQSRVLARNGSGVQALRHGPASWGFQFHPEFDERHLELIIDEVKNPAKHGIDVAARRAGLRPTPLAASLLRRFRDLVLAGEA